VGRVTGLGDVARGVTAGDAIGGSAARRTVPQDWQKVRDGGLAVPQAAQARDDAAAGASAGAGIAGRSGTSSPDGSPSHSRKAAQEPQNWSPRAFLDPQRRQMTSAWSSIGPG
jgi:hypothetical protein